MADPLREEAPEDKRRRLLAAASEGAIFDGVQRPWLTLGLLGAMLLLHLSLGLRMWSNGRVGWLGILLAQRPARLLTRAGGQDAELIAEGEVWRLLSCVFLHQSGLHLLLNGLAILGLGRLVESIWGRPRALAIFVLSGLFGSSLSWLGGTRLSVGASGAAFGLLAALVVFGFRFRSALPPELGRALRRRLLPWALLNLAIGALLPFIDNLAHLGGLLGGGLLALVLDPPAVPGRSGWPGVGPALALGLGTLLLATAAAVAWSW